MKKNIFIILIFSIFPFLNVYAYTYNCLDGITCYGDYINNNITCSLKPEWTVASTELVGHPNLYRNPYLPPQSFELYSTSAQSSKKGDSWETSCNYTGLGSDSTNYFNVKIHSTYYRNYPVGQEAWNKWIAHGNNYFTCWGDNPSNITAEPLSFCPMDYATH